MSTEEDAYYELCGWTLTHPGTFVHQHVVDAYAAQHAHERTKPIAITFALVGLYLHLARNFTGREVQLAHMAMAREKHDWPSFALPAERGILTAADVLRAEAGPDRERAIDAWCASVWNAYRDAEDDVVALLKHHAII